MAALVRCSPRTVSRLISGENLPRYAVFVAILGVLHATDEERVRAIELWEMANADTATIEHAATLPDRYMRFRMDEREAESERTVDAVIIPGMLQTPEYADALAVGNAQLIPGEAWSAAAAAERRDRQALLSRDPVPLRLHALIDEAALRRMIGGPGVMRTQLDHLVAMGQLPNVDVQAVPFGVGAYGALSGPVTILGFMEPDEADSAYVESLTGLDTVETVEHVSRLVAVWDDVAARALSAAQTAEFIRSVRDNGNHEH